MDKVENMSDEEIFEFIKQKKGFWLMSEKEYKDIQDENEVLRQENYKLKSLLGYKGK